MKICQDLDLKYLQGGTSCGGELGPVLFAPESPPPLLPAREVCDPSGQGSRGSSWEGARMGSREKGI